MDNDQRERLTDKHIKEFLENAALYVWHEYTRPVVNRAGLLIREIDAYCDKCDRDRPFQDHRFRRVGYEAVFRSGDGDCLATGTTTFMFTCASCNKYSYTFLVEQIVDEKTVKFQKFGQLPRMKLERDKALQKFFADDSESYEKGLASLTNGYGIGAFGYFRRITENNIARLLDLIFEDAEATGDEEKCQAINELRREQQMSARIKVANRALPDYLNPHGLNPLGRLYQVLSEGIHSYSDEECLAKARTVQGCLTYLLTELATRKHQRERFRKLVGDL